MKKFLVVLMAAMMIFSLAAVSMAAATVEGDWRTEFGYAKSEENDDIDFMKNDLRLNFKGQVSDTVDAYMQYTFGTEVALKEWYVTFKQSWGTIKTGQWDNKIIPSRVLLKPHGKNCVNTKSFDMLVDVPVGDALTFGVWFKPTLVDSKAYDLKAAYKGDSFGVEAHIGDLNTDDKDLYDEYYSLDLYYNINSDIKVFAYAVNFDEKYTNAKAEKLSWDKELAPVVGATFKNIAGSKLTASLEYSLVEASDDYTPYGLQLKYGFNNKVNLEFEYTNVDKDNNKLVIRPRVKF